MKRLLPVALILILLGAAALSGLWQQYQHFLLRPMNFAETGSVLVVERGASIRSVVAELQQRGVTRMDWRWRLLSRLRPLTIQAGEYDLKPVMTPPDLLKMLAGGRVINYRFTIIEGWTSKQLIAELGENPVLKQTITDVAGLTDLAGSPNGDPEGWFLPETYLFIRGDSDRQILQRAHAAMQEALAEAWSGRAAGLPYETPYDLLILASIVEKETSRESERAAIAGVFVRRLLKKWRLETDPTVIYGMGETYKGDIRRRDLKNDTPYNTYTRHGLPPTPIALPGLASLQAAAHPAAGAAMFFVADGHGGHTFSSTLEEHNEAVKKLIEDNQSKPDNRE